MVLRLGIAIVLVASVASAGKAGAPGHLECQVDTFSPFLDFFFRFEATYVLSCPVRQFNGSETRVEAFVRVIPEGGPPVVVGSLYTVPAVPAALRASIQLERVATAAEVSGGFAIGEGHYSVELLAVDDRNREYRHRWKVHARRSHEERTVAMTMQPGTAAALEGALWTGEHHVTPRRQVTVLVNASPINPSAHKLRAWDRAFLLGSVSSVLRGLSYSSVRLVAFNLDQQREIFRADNFDETAMPALEGAMRDLELGVVSYKTLRTQDGWIDLLRSLARDERKRADASDAVIFLGPWTRRDTDTPRFVLDEPCRQKPRFFNIVYYAQGQRGREYEDGIQRLTSKQEGVSYRIHSPGELAQALQKLNYQLQRSPQETSASR